MRTPVKIFSSTSFTFFLGRVSSLVFALTSSQFLHVILRQVFRDGTNFSPISLDLNKAKLASNFLAAHRASLGNDHIFALQAPHRSLRSPYFRQLVRGQFSSEGTTKFSFQLEEVPSRLFTIFLPRGFLID